jgi:hypothetical protein
MGRKGMDWITLAQDREEWRTVLNTAMELCVPYHAGNFLTG